MPLESPFGRSTRLRILQEYFAQAGTVSAQNAWEHAYRLLLWLDERTGLAHIYDSNHMQPGGNFYARAVRFTEALCRAWNVERRDLGKHIDILFKGCVKELMDQEAGATEPEASAIAKQAEQEDAEESGLELDDTELVDIIMSLLDEAGFGRTTQTAHVAREIEQRAKVFFALGNKRKNALGEGFEDLLEYLLTRVANVPTARIRVRTSISELPGFKRASPVSGRSGKTERLPKPDIAIVNDHITYAIITAKWSMRQDRETQFAHEYDAYMKNKVQSTDLQFFLLTNEYDVARLNNVARAQPGAGGYLFHTIFHLNPTLLQETQADKIREVEGWIKAGRIASLQDFLSTMAAMYGTKPIGGTPPKRPRKP